MKAKFASTPVGEARIVHGEDVITIALTPTPFGYLDMLDRVYPAPVEFVNGKPAPKAGAESEWSSNRVLLMVAKAMGEQLESKAPAETADRPAWHAYAIAIRSEFEASNFLPNDVYTVSAALHSLNTGAVTLGKV